MHALGNNIFPVQGEHPTVDVWAFRKPGIIHILLTNAALPRHPVKTELINVQLKTIEQAKTIYAERIDDTHANARAAWITMGEPDSLKPDEVKVLELASRLHKEQLEFTFLNNMVSMDIELPPQGVALITIETV